MSTSRFQFVGSSVSSHLAKHSDCSLLTRAHSSAVHGSRGGGGGGSAGQRRSRRMIARYAIHGPYVKWTLRCCSAL